MALCCKVRVGVGIIDRVKTVLRVKYRIRVRMRVRVRVRVKG